MNSGRYRFRKRLVTSAGPVMTVEQVVTAEQVRADDWDDVLALARWAKATAVVERGTFERFSPVAIMYVGGWAFDRDWVVRSVEGRFWVVDAVDFDARFEVYA